MALEYTESYRAMLVRAGRAVEEPRRTAEDWRAEAAKTWSAVHAAYQRFLRATSQDELVAAAKAVRHQVRRLEAQMQRCAEATR